VRERTHAPSVSNVSKERVVRTRLRLGRIAMLLVGLVLGVSGPVRAGTTGKIAGRVLDAAEEPIASATIRLIGQPFGAYSDAEGRFTILNVPPGTYEVSVTRLGYAPFRITDVQVSADLTTQLSVEMTETAVAMEEVVVTAPRPPVDLNLTSSQATLTTEEIESLPVQDLEDVVNLQAGVVDGHFRGGRQGEVQYQVDGVSVNNAFDNKSLVTVDRSLLQEVQVISGTFDAEYGQAMSGVVNAVLKEGSEELWWTAEAYGGSFVFPGRDSRLTDDELNLGGIQNYQLTVSGPTPVPKTVYLVSGRRYLYEDFVQGERKFLPTDESDFENKEFYPTGNGEEFPLGYSREWSGVAKLTTTAIDDVKFSYQALYNRRRSRQSNFQFRLNPDGLSKQRSFSLSHGLDYTHTLSAATILDVSLRQNLIEYEDYVYEDLFDPRYDAAGPPRSDSDYELGAVVQGVQFTRFLQHTNAFLGKASVVSQVTPEHQVKIGGEIHVPRVKFGSPGHLTYTTVDGVQTLVRYENRPPDYPGPREYKPVIGAAFVQDQVEWPGLTLRAGLRFDVFAARSTVPSDPSNPANAIAGAPPSYPVWTSPKVALSPRLGVAYPIEDRAALHFAYGHFRQFPAIGEIFTNADYDVLENLQASGVSYGVLGNPDVEPETTIQYEFGYKHALTPDFGADVSVFYKDVRDLLGVEFISTYNNAEYARLTNVDFGNIFGFTIALDHRRLGPASVSVDYTWQQALGNSSNPRETAVRAEAGEDPRPRLIPFDWDQRHTLNLTLSLAPSEVYSASAVFRVASGQPYTPILEAGFGQGLEENSGRKPTSAVLDLRAERKVNVTGVGASLFARVFNVFDTKFFNGAVFNSTGSPYYSRFTEADRVALADPTRFYPPRRVEIGIRLVSEGP
jgi:outer membrane receptor protein involved in Fe transport